MKKLLIFITVLCFLLSCYTTDDSNRQSSISFDNNTEEIRGANIFLSKTSWRLNERIKIQYNGLNSSKKYMISAYKRGKTGNSNPIKTRIANGKSSGTVYMRLRTDQGVKAGKYEFHLYSPWSNQILDKELFTLSEGSTNPNPPTNGSKLFTASSGTTDLNYADTVAFIDEYSKLGFRNTKYQKTVTKSQLTAMLSNKINMHFHSGHGNSGSINCTDGDISVSSLAGKIQPTYSIYCICSSFSSSSWGRSMGSNARMVMGFNKTVTDGSCLNLARKFPEEIRNGNSYLMAWYKSNSVITGHKDRWATYVKEGSKVVLYKAGGNTPRYPSHIIPVTLSDGVLIDELLLNSWKDKIHFGSSFPSMMLHPASTPIDIQARKREFPTRRSYITADEALSLVIIDLSQNSNLPDSASLDTIIPIDRCNVRGKCFTVAQDISFVHKHNGLNIRSSSMVVDYINVLIDDEGVIITDISWSKVMPLDDGPLIRNVTLSVADTLVMAADSISNLIRESVRIVDYSKVYGITFNDRKQKILVPAYEFIGDNGERFVANAYSGQLI